jgi:hypothetical protein
MMKGKWFLILVAASCLIIEGAVAQKLIPKKCYMHLTGAVDKEFPMEMELVKNNDTVFGECFFPGKNGLPELPDYDGTPLPVCGNVTNDGRFVIKIDPWNKPLTLTGNLDNNRILTGICGKEINGQGQPFRLSEKYPEGSTPMNAFFQKGSVSLVKKPGSPSGKIRLSLLLPGESANPLVSDSLKKIVLSEYAGTEVRTGDAEKVMNSVQQIYFDTYVNDNIDLYNQHTGQPLDWILLTYMHVVQNNANLLSFYVEKYAYTGGAHGLETRKYTTVNMLTGRIVRITDLLHGDYEAKLTEMLTKKARKKFNIPPDSSLTGAGLFVDEIKPSSEFYVTRTGIGFFYNQYDIAPHSWGTSDFVIPYGELKDFLLTTGILRGLLQ